jgi:hypothetical protein
MPLARTLSPFGREREKAVAFGLLVVPKSDEG